MKFGARSSAVLVSLVCPLLCLSCGTKASLGGTSQVAARVETSSAQAIAPDQSSRAEATNVPLRKPLPGARQTIPTGFSKSAPGSIADLKSMEQHVKVLLARVSPAVVSVEVGGASGSGVVISADGLVLSAGHVCVSPGRDAKITFPGGKTVRGKTLGANHETDCGLIRITERGSWPRVDLAESGSAKVGDWVLALGHPGGYESLRPEVVRFGRVIETSSDVVRSDCTISPGDSGGALFDMHGRVVGIHSYISSSPAENYHVPMAKFYDDWAALSKGDSAPTVARMSGFLGIEVEDSDSGCRVTEVRPNSPAARLGLRQGDVVVKVDGRDIMTAETFKRWIKESTPGDTLALEVLRDAEPMSLSVRLGRPPRGS